MSGSFLEVPQTDVVFHVRMCFLLSDLCRECREGFIFQQQRDMREYAQATVYVRKVIDKKMVSLCMITCPQLNPKHYNCTTRNNLCAIWFLFYR